MKKTSVLDEIWCYFYPADAQWVRYNTFPHPLAGLRCLGRTRHTLLLCFCSCCPFTWNALPMSLIPSLPSALRWNVTFLVRLSFTPSNICNTPSLLFILLYWFFSIAFIMRWQIIYHLFVYCQCISTRMSAPEVRAFVCGCCPQCLEQCLTHNRQSVSIVEWIELELPEARDVCFCSPFISPVPNTVASRQWALHKYLWTEGSTKLSDERGNLLKVI